MDRLTRKLITAACGFAAMQAFAQEPDAGSPPQPGAEGHHPAEKVTPPHPPGSPDKQNADFNDIRRVFENLPPEARRKFRENFRRWKEMRPEDREELRHQELRRKERMAREISETIQKAGLQLNADQREVFALRYAQERRRIEEALRKEMEAKRRPMVQEMMERLKREFANTNIAASPSPTATPAGSTPAPPR
jgi:dsDNA-binding SOS-regulon protein